MVNILLAGCAGRNFEFQDFLAVPLGFATYAEALKPLSPCTVRRAPCSKSAATQ
jgi:hypothetical protein